MCGICGILDFEGKTIDRNLLKKMCDTLAHRGPDAEGIYINKENSSVSLSEKSRQPPKIGLGYRRLSIIDIEGGYQPMSNENETVWIVEDGEIYNFRELRENLERNGHKFKTRSDTEVIVHLYEDYGISCVKYLRGMFAFAIWDENKKLLLGARDRLGKNLFVIQ